MADQEETDSVTEAEKEGYEEEKKEEEEDDKRFLSERKTDR